MTYEEITEHCIELRRAFERDEARFFLGLAIIEQTHMRTLRSAGCDTFDNFIRSHELCKPERYHSFVTGLQHTNHNEALMIGAPAVIALAGLENRRKLPEYLHAIKAWSAEHHGLTPRIETARYILRQVDPRVEIPDAVKKQGELARLRAENAELRSRIAKLERENLQLRRTGSRSKKRAA